MQAGDHIVSQRFGYSHHGLYVGEGRVIHYAGFNEGLTKGMIEETSLDEFAQSEEVDLMSSNLRVYDRSESVARARSKIGEDSYNLVFNNCEHFVSWCIYGLKFSKQVQNVVIHTVRIAIEMKKYIQSETVVASVVSAASSAASSSLTTSSTVGSIAGITAGGGTVFAATTTTAVTAVVGTSVVATVAAPVAVTLGVGYGVKKAWDWIFD